MIQLQLIASHFMIKWFVNIIDKHFFEPQFIKDLSIVRIVLITVQLYFLLSSLLGHGVGGANLESQRFSSSIHSLEYYPGYIMKIFMAPFGWGARPEYMLIQAVWLIAVITGFTSLIGIYKKPGLFIFAFACTFLVAHKYSYWEQHHHEAVLILFLWVLAFGDNKRTWSIDNLKRRIILAKTKMKFNVRDINAVDIYSRWPLRVMQWLFVLVYFSAGYEKLRGGFNSYTLMMSFAKDGLLHDKEIALWLAQNPFLLDILVPVTLIFELCFGIIMFFPNITWVFVLFGSLFHLSIFIIHAPPFYHYLALYIVFIEPIRNTIKKRFKIKVKTTEPKWNIIYDGLCPLCIRTVTIINYFDLQNILGYLDLEKDKLNIRKLKEDLKYEDVKHSMHLIGPKGRTYKGFYAFRRLTLLLPFLWILVPFLYFPFIDKAGNYFYKIISGKRKTYHCNLEACEVE